MIATVTAAVVFGNYGPGRALTETGADAIDTVWEFLAYLLTAVVFLLVGLAIPPARLLGSLAPIVWVVAAMLVGRASSSTGCWAARLAPRAAARVRRAVPGPWLHVLFWARPARGRGRRDGAGPADDMPQRALLQDITFGAVLFTLLVQATTIGWVVARARPTAMPEERSALALAVATRRRCARWRPRVVGSARVAGPATVDVPASATPTGVSVTTPRESGGC